MAAQRTVNHMHAYPNLLDVRCQMPPSWADVGDQHHHQFNHHQQQQHHHNHQERKPWPRMDQWATDAGADSGDVFSAMGHWQDPKEVAAQNNQGHFKTVPANHFDHHCPPPIPANHHRDVFSEISTWDNSAPISEAHTPPKTGMPVDPFAPTPPPTFQPYPPNSLSSPSSMTSSIDAAPVLVPVPGASDPAKNSWKSFDFLLDSNSF
uniref:Uncharacterized protein n=1 Tax=Caenorhabditis japonica TaxID=281687 RepID=A0A8R1I357_CAEJA